MSDTPETPDTQTPKIQTPKTQEPGSGTSTIQRLVREGEYVFNKWRYPVTHTLIIDSTTPPIRPVRAPMDKRPEPEFKIPKDIPKKKLRILMLHGYRQNARIFAEKTMKLQRRLAKVLKPVGLEVEMIIPTAPHRADPVREDYAWYRKDTTRETEYCGLEEGMNHIAQVLRETRKRAYEEDGEEDGGVDCVLGFSQGACVGAMLIAALESVHKPRAATERVHQGWLDNVRDAHGHRTLKFGVLYCGFMAAPLALEWLYNPKIVTPVLHVVGSLDTIVGEMTTKKLADKCTNAWVSKYIGGHSVRTDNTCVPVLQYILFQVSPEPEPEKESEADEMFQI